MQNHAKPVMTVGHTTLQLKYAAGALQHVTAVWPAGKPGLAPDVIEEIEARLPGDARLSAQPLKYDGGLMRAEWAVTYG